MVLALKQMRVKACCQFINCSCNILNFHCSFNNLYSIFTRHRFDLKKPLSLLIHRKLASSFSSAASSPLLAFRELNRVSTLLWTRLWLSEYYGWFDLLPRPLQLSPSQQMAGYLSHRLCVLWSSSFLQECLLCIHSLSIWLKRPSFQPVLTPNMPSSLSLIISHFWCRLRYKQFFSLEPLEVIVGH